MTENPQSSKVHRPGQPDVFFVPDEETRMNQAVEKARLTMGYFLESLNNPKPHQQYFSLKAKFTDGIHAEHIWINQVSMDESGNFFGELANEPVRLTNLHAGQRVGVQPGTVSDWMILENGRLIGGYTLRALRDGMEQGERETFDANLGFFIDEGVDHYDHNHETPEGAILLLEDAYDRRDLDACIAAKDFQMEAFIMLAPMPHFQQSENKDQLIQKTADALKSSFTISILEKGFPTFDGITRAFPYRQWIHDDLVIITEVCCLPDSSRQIDRLYVSRRDGIWRVASVVR